MGVCVSAPALVESCRGGGVENRWMGVTGSLLRSLLELGDFPLINKLLSELLTPLMMQDHLQESNFPFHVCHFGGKVSLVTSHQGGCTKGGWNSER